MTRTVVPIAGLLAIAAMAGACGGDGPGSRNPVAPSPPFAGAPASAAVQRPATPAMPAARVLRVPAPMTGGRSAVEFPPRNETYDFRQRLEQIYRNSLNRAATSSYVDIEGTVVWVQEYLRYRVNLCSHAAAVALVMSQIDGGGVAEVCGVTTALTFPPRNESVDFMQQLEAKYQHGLRRAPTTTFVDVAGRVVWTQEYLRYRAELCSWNEAFVKISAQIHGSGVQPGCRPDVGIVGYWDGVYAGGAQFTMVFTSAGRGRQPNGAVDGIFVRVSSLGNRFTLFADYNERVGEWIAEWDGGDRMQGTASGVLTHAGAFTATRRR